MRLISFVFMVLFVAFPQVNGLTPTYPELNYGVWSDFEFNGGSNLADGIPSMSFYDDLLRLQIANKTSYGMSSSIMVEAEFENNKPFLQDPYAYMPNNSIYLSYIRSPMSLSPWNDVRLDCSAFAFLISPDYEPQNMSSMLMERRGLKALHDSGSEYSLSTNSTLALDNYRGLVFIGGINISILLLMIAINLYCCKINKARNWDEETQDIDRDEEGREPSLEHEIEIAMIGPKKYQLAELKSATDNFNAHNEIGRGGFGIVYRGTLGGKDVAVKRTSRNDQQGRKNMIAEVTTIGSLHHKNLVKLFGWCSEGNELILVYEYMPNGSLDTLLYPEDEPNQAPTLTWEKRYSIICGVAQSIDYLHNECSRRVVHRDIKTSNVMLDGEFNACLSDFGLARMFKASEKMHHSSQEIAGTRAYMAPEIFFTGKATTETDVYAFGVLVLEVACGRNPGEGLGYSIVDWVWEVYGSGMIYEVMDPKMNEGFDKEEAECVLKIGMACCHPEPRMRPSMRSALRGLMGQTKPPSVPHEKPAFVWPSPVPPLSTLEVLGDLSGSLSGLSGR